MSSSSIPSANTAGDFVAHDVTKLYGSRIVLNGLSMTASPGQRVGLVGENGIGKSTLLRVLSGQEECDTGDVTRPTDLGFLAQELPYEPSATFGSVIEDALAELRTAERRLSWLGRELEKRPTDAELLAEYGELVEWAQAHDLWDADRRADLVLAGLGMVTADRDRPLSRFSGGERSRLALSALLIRQPAALLLDEPTNHLDDDAIEFLEKHLASLPGVIVLASHDRVFLNAVCTDIVDLDPSLGGITRYGGAYSEYLKAKRVERARWEQQYAEEQDELKALRFAVRVTARKVSNDGDRGNTSKMAYDFKGNRVDKQISRRVRNAQQRLDDLTRTQVRKPRPPLRFAGALTDSTRADGTAATLSNVSVDGRLSIESLTISFAGRLLVTGPNGAGKTTLLRVLAGQLAPDTGSIHRAARLRFGLLEQDVVFPDPRQTPRRLFAAVQETRPGQRLPSPPELGLISPRDADQPVAKLSAGQRRRLALALLIARPPEVLLLDEPTNHLSLHLADELSDALDSAPGAIVVASHDRWFRRTWTGDRIELQDGRLAGID